jgi:hypothetical protein
MSDDLGNIDRELDEQYGEAMNRVDIIRGLLAEAKVLKPLIERAGGDFDPATFVYTYVASYLNNDRISDETAASWIIELTEDGTFQRAIETLEEEA